VVVPAGAAPGEPPRRGAAAHELHLHVGGAIVADSDPAREHAETEAKAAAFHQAVARLGARRRRPRYPPGAWPASLS
jgi:hypothetical protein